MDRKLKVVVLGDSLVGKTSLLFAYTEKRFMKDVPATVFDNWSLNVTIEQRLYNVNLFDTAGQEDYSHLRTLSYPSTDVFILCFSMVEPKTLEACEYTWMPEIRHFAGDKMPVILAGTKHDMLEKATPESRVSLEEAQRVANKLGCARFVPCSSLTHYGLKEVFDDAFLAALNLLPAEKPKSSTCCLLQ